MRKNVGQYQIGQEVTVVGQAGRYRITGFPSRRTATVAAVEPRSGDPSTAKVSLLDITILQPRRA